MSVWRAPLLVLTILGSLYLGIAQPASATTTATFGKSTVGTYASAMSANLKRVNRYSVAVPASVTQLSMYLQPTSYTGQQAIEGILYADSSGSPGARLGVTNQLVFAHTSSAGWYALNFASPVSVPAGHYWIGVISGGTAQVAAFRYDQISGSRFYNSNTYSYGPSNPFGSHSTDSLAMSLYASYTGTSVSAPSASSTPAVSGTPQVGNTLTASTGSWTGSPTGYAYAWERCGSSCTPVQGAASQAYAVQSGDVGSALKAVVTASNSGGSASATSAPTATVTTAASASPPPASSSPVGVTISGTTYYVSPAGSDSNSGTSSSQPWRTVNRVNNASLRPGDGVLFQGGQTFSDATLMPITAGTSGSPIVFESYGTGQAKISQGVWFVNKNYLTFDNLVIGPNGNFQGGNSSGSPASNIVVENCDVNLGAGNATVGINADGNNWTIAGNTVQNTGDSGMYLTGDSYKITNNTINNTGLNSGISYPKHGIYLKVSNATVSGNTITNFSEDGVSVRYRNSDVTGNHISGGNIGIAWFQYDTTAGTSYWTNNTITTSTAGIYVSSSDVGGSTMESFVINGNTLGPQSGSSGWVATNLHSTSGTYSVSSNTIL